MRRRPLLRGLALLLLSVVAASAWVRDRSPLWSDGTVTLHLQLGTAPTYSDGSTPDGTALEAMKPWNPAMARVQLAGVAGSTAPVGPRNGVNNVVFATTIFGQPFDPDVVAVTVTFTSDGARGETDVIVRQPVPWDAYRGPPRREPELRRVLMHEFGHVLGLGHPDEQGELITALMNSRSGFADTPTDDDLNGAAALYGLGAGTPGAMPPQVLLIGGGGTVEEGEAMTFVASIFGTAPMVLQWFRDQVPLPGANRPRLELTGVRMADAGSYTLRVTNSAGTVTSAVVQLTVIAATPPTIALAAPGPFTVRPGEPLSLSFDVRGTRPMTLTWRRDGVIVEEFVATSSTASGLTLETARASDAGNYTLTATNALGSATSPALRVVVQPPAAPVIVEHPASRTVEPDTSTGLGGTVTGSQPIQYEWRKDGLVVPGRTEPGFFIARMSAADAGLYTFRVTNAHGSAESRPARLSLANARFLRITAQPRGVQLMAQGAFFLNVTALGSGPLAYQWYKDGVALPGETRSDYRGMGATPADAGSYTVTVANATTRLTSDPAVVSYHPAMQFTPRLIVQPAATAVRAGETAELSAFTIFDGVPLTYQWRRNGVDLPGRTEETLRLVNAQPADTGDYAVTVRNAAAAVVSKTVRLTVSPLAPVIRRHPRDAVIEYGVWGGLDVELAPGSWQRVQWQRDGQAIPGATTTGLSFRGATTADAGSYRAVVTTTTGETLVSEPATVTVPPLLPPRLRVLLANQTAMLGDVVTFSTDVFDPIRPTLQWHRNGAPIPGATGLELRLTGLRAEDVGTYRVVLTNPAGSTTSNDVTLSLYSSGPPVIAEHPASRTAAPGSSLTLFVRAANSAPVRQYQWYKDGVALPDRRDAGFALTVTPETTGRYQVVLTNGDGSTPSDDVWIELLPGTLGATFALQPASRQVTAGSSVSFSALATGATPPTYQWRREGVDLPGATSSTLGIESVTPAMAGRYTVVATDSLGSVESAPATLTVDPAGRLLNLSARALSRGGSEVLIAGFVVQGGAPKRLLVRGIGPSLRAFGVEEVLSDPKLTIYDAAGRTRAAIENWEDYFNRNALVLTSNRVGAFALPASAGDAALILTLDPGSYTAHVTNAPQASPRVGLVELYDLESGAPRLINLSTRARVAPGDGALIAGFVVEPGAPKRLLVRAVGPGLALFDVGDLLADPRLEIIPAGAGAALVENDNWSDGGAAPELAATFARVGAFALAAGSKDAAAIVTLAPGAYTARVTGAGEGSGNALVEVYELAP